MRRARHPLPLFLRDLTFNPTTGWYEITDRGVTYHMTMEHTRSMKEYFKAKTQGTLDDWYNNFLSRKEKSLMQRTGNYREKDTGFRADESYDE